jgi:hypothetical protein
MASVDNYAVERDRQQRGKTMICDFFDNITPHQKSVDLKAITQKYNSYREIDSEITRLSLQLAEEDRKLNAFSTFFDTTKQRHRDTIATIQGQLAVLNSDKQIIDSVFRDYETNLRRNDNNSYWLNKIIFFEVVRNNCELLVQATTDFVHTVVATPINPNTGGRKSRKRKSRRRKSKKSRKSRKSRK